MLAINYKELEPEFTSLEVSCIHDLKALMEYDKNLVLEASGLTTRAKKIGEMLRKLFSKTVEILRELISKISDKIQNKCHTIKVKADLAKIKRQLKASGDLDVEFIDVWKYESVFKYSVTGLSIYVNKFMKNYEKFGKGPRQAREFLTKTNAMIDDSQKKLDEIKSNRKMFQASKILKWIEENVNDSGNAIGIMRNYMKTLEKAKGNIDIIEKKLDAYLVTHDYIEGPKNFSEFMHNSSRYVARNADWISMYAASGLLRFSSFLSRTSKVASMRNSILTGNGKYDGPNTELDYTNANRDAKTRYHDKNYHSTRKSIERGSKAASSIALGTGMKLQYDAKKKRRNSI